MLADPFKPFLDFLNLPMQVLLLSLVTHHEISASAGSAVMRETQKVKRFRFSAAFLSKLPCPSAKLNNLSFIGRQAQTESLESVLQGYQTGGCILLALPAHHKVIPVSDQLHVSFRTTVEFPFKPEVQNIVQRDIGEQGAEIAALRGALSADLMLARFDTPCFQELAYQPQQVGV